MEAELNSHCCDVVVIGTGPGGEGAAMQAAKLGRSVAAVERLDSIGGNCTHLATIPSKTLRFAVHQLTSLLKSRLADPEAQSAAYSFPMLRNPAAGECAREFLPA